MKGYKNIFRMYKILVKIKPFYIIELIYGIITGLFYTLMPIGLVQVVVSIYENRAIEGNDYKKVLIACLIFAAGFYILNVSRFYMNMISERASRDFQAKFENIIFDKLDVIDYEEYQSSKFLNDYTRAIDEGPWRISNAKYAIRNLFQNLTSLIAIFSIFATLNWIIIIFASVIGIIYIFIGRYNANLSWKLSEAQKPHYRHRGYFRRMFYLKDAAMDIRTSKISEILIDENEDVCEQVIKNTDKYASKRAIMSIIGNILIRSIYPIALGIIGYFLIDNTSLLSVATLVTAAGVFGNQVWNLSESIAYAESAGVHGEAIFKVFNKSGVIETSGSIEVDDFNTIDINNISFKYGDNTVLNDINIHINKGEKIAIVGENGAGKTTLVKLLLRLYDVNNGSILYNGDNYKDIKPNSIRSKVGAAFQESELYAFSIAENILMKKIETEDDEKLIHESLRFVGLDEKVKSFEDGIHTQVTKEFNKEGAELSGGEKQKLALARVFAANYDLIILDEPNSALDPIAEADLYEKMMKLGDNHTMIFISHRLSTTIKADRIYLFEEGRIIESGSHKELMTKENGKYRYMFNIQSQNYINGGSK